MASIEIGNHRVNFPKIPMLSAWENSALPFLSMYSSPGAVTLLAVLL